jgi:hypothetical protein
MKSTLTILVPALIIILLTLNCTDAKKENVNDGDHAALVFNVDNKTQESGFDKLELDKTHPNLLDPDNPDYKNEAVMQSWTSLHKNLLSFLNENNFSWGTADKSIKSFQKIYFDKNGKITHYCFKVINQSVTEDKKEEFAKLLKEFSFNFKIDIQKEHPFAQCGPTAYQNF